MFTKFLRESGETLEQAAKESGGGSVPGGFQEVCKYDTGRHGLVS